MSYLVSSPVPRRADPPRFRSHGFGGGAMNPSAVDSIAAAIQAQEGYYPGSVAYTNNNPGNLVYAGQPGATQGSGGFASFVSYDAGLTALKNQITLDASRGADVNGNPTTTLAQLIASWAPPSANDTSAYISNVAAATGFDPSDSLLALGSSVSSTASGDGSGSSSAPGFDFSSILSGVTVPVAIGGLLLVALLWELR